MHFAGVYYPIWWCLPQIIPTQNQLRMGQARVG